MRSTTVIPTNLSMVFILLFVYRVKQDDESHGLTEIYDQAEEVNKKTTLVEGKSDFCSGD